MTAPLVSAQDLSKRYRLFKRPRDRLLQMLLPLAAPRHSEIVALDGVNFTVMPGECLGLIGANGSGKSTLLKLLVGSTLPSGGRVSLKGTVLAILELGAGLNPDLTGRENIHAAASMFGFPAGYAAEREADIVEFCGIGDFIDIPARKYSSGMLTRIAFSIFSFLEPNILIIDEALAVGDADFQLKCFRRIEQLIGAKDRAVILVSHDMNAINRFCDRVIWLDKGRIAAEGEPADVTRAYVMSSTRQALPVAAPPPETPETQYLPLSESAIVYRSDACTIDGVWLENAEHKRVGTVGQGEAFDICYSVSFHAALADPVFGIRLVNKRGDVVLSTNTLFEQVRKVTPAIGMNLELRWAVRGGLLPGDYFITCGISRESNLHDFAARYIDAFPLKILGSSAAAGYVLLAAPPSIQVQQ
ncbi:ABC transporter ATP-binding protein [Ferrovibrio sp. MS7]|uniref:ABC transporter ATP-binding protein n=1 Tax=Ferrovibrio plantarum TaxID=3119164 RepID=UPI0031352C58